MLVREPGTTPLGWYLRDWLKRQNLRDATISHGAELFLFAAARAEFVTKVLRPALEQRHKVVVADRYADSTTAYQGYGRRLGLADVALINRLATQDVMPDLTFLLDCSAVDGLKRVGSLQIRLPLEPADRAETGRVGEEGARRFEEESLDFHHRVREGYLELARQEPGRWCVIDATRPVEEIGSIVWERVKEAVSENVNQDDQQTASDLPLWAGNDDAASGPEAG